MRPLTKYMMVSAGPGLLIAVLLFVFGDVLIDAVPDIPGPVGAVAKVLLWPVPACLYLSGTGPNIGSPEKHWHEWTPVQDFAVATGIGLSWVFYSSLPRAPHYLDSEAASYQIIF